MPFRAFLFSCFRVSYFVFALLLAAPLVAAEPEIRGVSVRGLQVGDTTNLVIDGDAFGAAPRLLLPFPARQQLLKGVSDKRAAFDVTLAGDVTPGYYQLRLATAQGVSLPVVIAVDRLAQRPLATSAETLPVALHGAVNGSATTEVGFAGKAGRKVRVEVEAQRLGSKLRPVVHLFNAKKLQLAWAWPTPALSGDARLEAVLPADGTYTVSIHDVEYAAPAPAFFRLRVGDWSFVDQVFPPVVGTGQGQAVELLGSSPHGEQVRPTGAGALPLAWPRDALWSGPRPYVRVSPRVELVRQGPPATPQALPPGPVGVSGKLLTPFAEDRNRVPVTPGSKLRIEVFAERYGSPLDTALVVRNERGDVLARAEDSPGTVDPALDYTVPDKVTALVVGVVDAQGRGGPHGIYHLSVEPQTAAATDFRLLTPAQRITLPSSDRTVVPVWVERRGYQGDVALTAAGLPAGVRLENAVIPGGADGTLVTLEGAAMAADAVITHWHGRGAGEERPVVVNGHPLERLQPWLATELALAPAGATGTGFQVAWRGLPPDAGLVPGRKLALPVKVTRPADNSLVKFTLTTSQSPQLLNNQPNPNATVRLEKAVELPAKATDGDLTLLVPPQLSSAVYDVTVQAELLAPDRKTVRAVAYAPVRRLPVRDLVVVRLDGPARFEAARDAKKATTVKIAGKVERREGAKGDVLLALTGLPAGASAAAVTVKADQSAFVVNVVLPPGVAAGEIAGLTLAGTVAADPKQPNVRVRSREVAVTLVLK
jgi:hypothetical protein